MDNAPAPTASNNFLPHSIPKSDEKVVLPSVPTSALSLQANLRQRVSVNKCVHIRRALSGPGKIFVAKNEEIQPHDIIGKSTLSAGFCVVNIASKLGVSPQDGLKFLQRSVGRNIYRGELLAFKKGLLNKKFLTAPTDGLIEHYDEKTGELRIQFLPKEIPLTAGVAGIVDDVVPESGEVLIKTYVTEVFGAYGSGKERTGLLDVLAGRGDLMQSANIKEEMRQYILVCGALVYGEALRKAAGFGVAGLISGGLNASDYKSVINSIDPLGRIGSDVGLSIMGLEGFGPLPISEDIFALLKAHHGKFVIIHGNTGRLLLPNIDPESIVALRKIALPFMKLPDVAPEIMLKNIKISDRVRITWPPFMGTIGKVLALDNQATKLESGIITYLLTIETSSRKIKVPYTNIELI
jgi:hypothetical protein